MNEKKLNFWKYMTYKMLSLNSSFIFPLEYFFSENIFFDKEIIKESLLNNDKGLYIHIPFCIKICDYCGCFKQKVTKKDDFDKYVEYIIKELEIFYKLNGEKKLNFSTVMFGGGTASILKAKQLDKLIGGIYKFININEIKQFSFEASPFTLNKEKIDVLSKHNINRISIGVQSFNKEVLEKNNRIYVSYDHLENLINYIQSLGILVQIDLMVGIKGQNEENCIDDYRKMMDLGVDSYTINYYIPHGYANFGDTKESLHLKEKIRTLDKKMNNISKNKDSYLLQEEYVFNNFDYSVLGLGVGATSNLGNKIIYRKSDFYSYYDLIDKGEIPYDSGILMNHKFPYVKYIFEKYDNGEINFIDFKSHFDIELLDTFGKEIRFLELEKVVKIEEDRIIFLKNKFENRIYLNIFIEDILKEKEKEIIPKLDKQFNLNLIGLIYE